MKPIHKFSLYSLFAATLLFTAACDHDDDDKHVHPQNDKGVATLQFENYKGDTPVRMGTTYTNVNGDSIRFDQVRYIVSNVKFIKADGTEYAEPDSYHLISVTGNSAEDIKDRFTVRDIPVGDYTKISFTFGVDSLTNHSLDLAKGDLVNIFDMSWDWNTGYKFLNAEGTYYDPAKPGYSNFKYHIGTDANRRTITLNSPVTIKIHGGDNGPKLHLMAEALAIFGGLNVMDVKANPMLMTGPADKTAQVADNIATIFMIHHVHNHH